MSQAVDFTAQVSVILAAPVLDTILQKMYPVFNADQGRFRVASIAANWQDLERNVRNIKADVVLIEGRRRQLTAAVGPIPGVHPRRGDRDPAARLGTGGRHTARRGQGA